MARAEWSIKPGDKFSRLEAVKFIRRGAQSVQYWEFKCECGSLHITVAAQVKNGTIKSCGCLRKEKQKAPRAGKHKMIKTAEYRTWGSMLRRCRYGSEHPRHGGRGISICDRWGSFENFYADLGPRPSPSHSLDRIDNDGNYEPLNCRWATAKEQARNRHNSINVNLFGEEMALTDAAVMLGIPYETLYWRLKRGKPISGLSA